MTALTSPSAPVASLRRLRGAALALALLSGVASVAGCASAPRPPVLVEAEGAAQSPAAARSRELAPQLYTHAEQLRERAEQAHADGDTAAAQVLGEQSLAAYERAVAHARWVAAQERLTAAERQLAEAQEGVATVDRQLQELEAEATALEMRVRVTLDKEPLAQLESTSPARTQARREAARALTSEAHLLCLATKLLGSAPGDASASASASADGLAKSEAAVKSLEEALGQGSTRPELFSQATEARAACLRHLTLARRPATAKAPAAGVTDTLLTELTDTGKLFAFRDDRGVVVVLRGVNEAGAAAALELLGRTAKAHPRFPVLVVGHASERAREASTQAQVDSVLDALKKAGAPRVEGYVAGTTRPVVAGSSAAAKQRNERVEVVFVSPAR